MYIDDLKLEVEKRLNILKKHAKKKSVDTHKKIRIVDFLKTIDKNNYSDEIILTSKIIKDVEDAIKNEFKTKSKTILSNRIEEALFFVSLIFNNFYFDKNTNFEKVFNTGVLIPKKIVEELLPVRPYFEIKAILEKAEIISEVQVLGNDFSFTYSKTMKIAKHYILNRKYKRKNSLNVVKNKYASKFFLLKENGCIFSNKQDSIQENYLPYENDQKNIQYLYHKHMFFDKSFLNVLNEQYTNYKKILKDENHPFHIKVKKLLLSYKSLNSHIFTSSEAYGRIYLPLHYTPSEFRSCIRIGNNEKLCEVFDIHCCFVFLSASLIHRDSIDEKLRSECKKIIKYTKRDIYNKILKYNNFVCSKENRNVFKESMMKWLFSNTQERYIIVKESKIVKCIDDYFKEKFPLFYKEVIFYKTRTFFETNENNEIIKIKKSNLSFACFEYESNIMFNYILPKLNEIYNDIPFISLHDGIFVTERYKDRTNEIKDTIINLLNEIE